TRVVDRFVPDADRRTNSPSLSETGANRADKAVIVALRGIAGASAEKLALARDGVSDVRDGGRNTLLDYETAGDGFYLDGSFIQHTSIAYTGTYGNVLLSSLSFILRLLTASAWEVTDPKRTVIFDAIERSFAPLMHDGLMLDCVAGRAVSRQTAGNHAWGNDTITGSLLLAESAPEPYASRFRALAKSWIEQRTAVPYLGAASLAVLPRALAVVGDDTIRPAEPPLGHTVFADMDRVLHRRRRWTFALSLSSKRIATYESGNGEHPRGWFTGDGMTYVYDRDQTHYSDAYWPTVDAQRLPGTTVDTLPRARFSGSVSRPATSWAGGVELGGAGAAGMDLAAWGCTLRAKKSWFSVGDAIVALGAGITSTDGRAIETIVDNRNLHEAGTHRLTVDGRRQPGDQGWSATFDGVSHAHLAGVGGYVFPGGADLRALREERTGSWRDINDGADTGGSTDPVTRRYVTLWFDHGANPNGADYAYILLPGADADETRRHALTRPIRVLANTAAVQAVSTRDGLLAANFWQGATVGDLASDGPASLLVRRSRGRLEVAVSDPSRTAATVTLDLPWAVSSVALPPRRRRPRRSRLVPCPPADHVPDRHRPRPRPPGGLIDGHSHDRLRGDARTVRAARSRRPVRRGRGGRLQRRDGRRPLPAVGPPAGQRRVRLERDDRDRRADDRRRGPGRHVPELPDAPGDRRPGVRDARGDVPRPPLARPRQRRGPQRAHRCRLLARDARADQPDVRGDRDHQEALRQPRQRREARRPVLQARVDPPMDDAGPAAADLYRHGRPRDGEEDRAIRGGPDHGRRSREQARDDPGEVRGG
ncbi:MAG TPA: polysaccharide lyase 8 family protein, partial [Phytomonospora sp.]